MLRTGMLLFHVAFGFPNLVFDQRSTLIGISVGSRSASLMNFAHMA